MLNNESLDKLSFLNTLMKFRENFGWTSENNNFLKILEKWDGKTE